MEVTTHTSEIACCTIGTMILEMLFAERNHVCSVCVANGHCELQALAQKLRHDPRRSFPTAIRKLPVDASHERFVVDHNRCILCTRCVRVCDEIEGAHTWDVMGRGSRIDGDHRSEPALGRSETCTSCGKCVQVCPTGALFEKERAGGKMRKQPDFLPYLNMMREGEQP